MIGKCIISFLNIWLGGAVFPVGDVPGIQFSIPRSHVALGGDLHVEIISTSFPPLLLQLSRSEKNSVKILTTFPVFPKAGILPNNFTVNIPCGHFSREGLYYIIIKKQPIGWKNSSFDVPPENLVTTKSLDVRWPTSKLTINADNLETYPDKAVTAFIEYPEIRCTPLDKTEVVEFFTELHFCGDSGNTMINCKNNASKNNTQVMYSEKIRGFPGRRVFTIDCQSFGLAGYYGLFLRSSSNSYRLPYSAAYVKVNWSDRFVFNVHARSIFPCDVLGGGVTVLFEYPSCILTTGDRIRLYARLRADVASLDPPTTLEYIAEHKVVKGQHSLYFECDLFTERYVEYCFVYVSKAITGTMTDIRMDCVPTMPVTDQESGGWGSWSPWTPCTSTCFGGTRSRYRFCDSPPPRYGAKFCEGSAVETEKCGADSKTRWDCLYGEDAGYIKDIVSDTPEVQTEVGSYCRCGCVVHLGQAKPTRLLATSSQSCPGRNFWLIQADANSLIRFRVIQFHLSCRSQWLKIRDGNALSSNLLAHLSAASNTASLTVNSTGENLLLEFFSADDIDDGEICGGGFIARATQIKISTYNVTVVPVAQNMGIIPIVILKMTAVHITAIFFLSGLLIATISLGIQYLFRYRKYHVAGIDDQDSLSNFSDVTAPLTTRVSSNVTLLSEVVSLSRLRPHLKLRAKHTRLRESADCDTLKQDEKVTLAKEESSSIGSTSTLTQLETATVPENDAEQPTMSTSLANSCQSLSTLKRSSTIDSDKDKSDEKTDINKEYTSRRPSAISNVTLTNVSLISKILSTSDPGCYSSAGTLVHKATIKSTSVKETKEMKNREKLKLVPTGSDFSISAQDIDLEMDYYDYNVVNAGAAPGSYLGMDPAFLVWIPPLDEIGEIFPDYDKSEYHEMAEIREYVDPGSNKESPEEDVVLLPESKEQSPVPKSKNIDNKCLSEVEPLVHKKISETRLEDLSKKLKVSPKLLREDIEKETAEKCLSFENIKFADDEDTGNLSENSCNTDIAYQEKNVISSR
ncbi:uncharacterized protein LOC130444338 isoform X1 [Diorhabda sublineata]|uniref:uncharacterized protein LOC130444338 isoform X1 n=1 Tax=Diorhabda sublineata TaxID=1163346 RepID=UPI0024E0A35C|nr:uncharacterized protein LOC130444338 isoform X1 [Diorhabda sublineata]